ncbi:MAG: NF038396 family protein [Paenarthrobacter sp.]
MLKKPETLFVLGYMLLPLLALISAIVGLTMILGGNRIAGIIVLIVVTQVFTFGAFFALRRRKALLLHEHDAGNLQPPR